MFEASKDWQAVAWSQPKYRDADNYIVAWPFNNAEIIMLSVCLILSFRAQITVLR